MKKSRFTEEQIVGILKQGEAGLGTGELCRQLDNVLLRLVKAAYTPSDTALHRRATEVQAVVGAMNYEHWTPKTIADHLWYLPFYTDMVTKYLKLLTIAPEHELNFLTNMHPGHYELEVILETTSIKGRPPRATITVDWTGDMNGGFKMTLNQK